MTRYEKITQIDTLANFFYREDYYGEETCNNSPLRQNSECPEEANGREISKEGCIKCIKAWLLEEMIE